MIPTGPTNRALYPKGPESLKSQWLFSIPQLSDPIESVEVNDEFLISLGYHSPHENYLLAPKRKPKLDEISQIESLLTFYLDCPSALTEPRFKKEANTLNRGLFHYQKKFHGITSHEFFRPFEATQELVDLASNHGLDSYRRHLDQLPYAEISWKIELPKNEKLNDALFVYRLASLSVDSFSRILNYWRCLEALTNKEEREDLFLKIPDINLSPVISYSTCGTKRFDIMKKYLHETNLHIKILEKKLGSKNEISKYFYKKRRCPIAHANDKPLRLGKEVSYGDLVRDTILLKTLSRYIIENHIQKS